MRRAGLIVLMLASIAGRAAALPQDAGALNVRDFGAKGDGTTDDTDAIRAAIAASGPDTGDRWWQDRIVYLPAGTYRVSGTLLKRYRGSTSNEGRFASGLALLGDGPDRTTIRLADHAPGFDDPAAPRPIVMTTSKLLDTGGSRDYVHKGEGNDAFENFVEDLTIDAGAANPGAVGIDYLANNLGAIRNVAIRAPAGSGATGIAMLRQVPGPALIQSTTVTGFRTGIAIAHSEYGMTLSGVALDGQTEIGLRNDGNVISAERLTIAGPGKAGIVNEGAGGLITLVDSDVGPIGSNRGTIVFRATHAALPNAKPATLDGVLQGDAPFRPSSVKDAPPLVTIATVDPGPDRRWVGVTGATDQTPVDATSALQSALNSGASTIYLRHGTFWIAAPLHIPASVHRIIGMNSTLRVFPHRQPGFSLDEPLLLVDTPGSPLQIERLAIDNSNQGAQLAIRHAGARPLLLRDIVSAGAILLDRIAQGGPAAVENVCCGPMRVAGPAPVTARQFDTEGGGVRVENAGAKLSIIGLKTEQESTVVRTTRGGRTDIIGGLVYLVVAPSSQPLPIFVSQDSQVTASFAEEILQRGHGYRVYLHDDADGRIEDTAADTMPARGLGHIAATLSTRAR